MGGGGSNRFGLGDWPAVFLEDVVAVRALFARVSAAQESYTVQLSAEQYQE